MTYQETTIQITFRHPVHRTEVPSDDVDGAEAVIEAGIAPQLLELYGGEIIIEKVTAATSPTVYSYEDAVRYHGV